MPKLSRSLRSNLHLGLAAALLLCTAAPVFAQNGSGQDTWGIPIAPQRGVTEDVVGMPPPPKALMCGEGSSHRFHVPAGASNVPQPNTPATRCEEPIGTGPTATGLFQFFQNSSVKPTGASTSPRTPEPASLINRDTAFQTGNWYAALSRDSAETWTHIPPSTFFASVDGGFCCDQKAVYVPSHDIVIWLLQYQAGATKNTYRFAVAKGRDKLRSGLAGDWYYYDFFPTHLGWGSGYWLDYPDLAFDGTWLHCSANVFPISAGSSGAVRWRISLDNMRDGVGASYSYSTNANLLGGSYRFSQGALNGSMYWACHKNTGAVYVYELPEASGTWTRYERAVAVWQSTNMSAPCPDGRDWCGFSDHRMYGGWASSTEIGFSWDCDNTTGRPRPYTRVARFRTSDKTLIAEHDIWNGDNALLYAAGCTNNQGDVGFVISFGGPTRYVGGTATIIDSYQPWGGLTLYSMGTGNSGPEINRWGDYFQVARHPLNGRTFIGNGQILVGGPSSAYAQPKWTWFGRDDFAPTWVVANVQSTGDTAVALTIDVTDRSGLKNGTTPFTRTYAPRQGYKITAPETSQSGSTYYVFDRWAYKSTPTSAYVLQPVDQLVLDIDDIGSLDDVCEARYVLRGTLNVQSTNPASGVAITVSKADINGAQNGTTAFTRYYKDTEVVTLTAPASSGGIPFKRWRLNGLNQTLGVTTLNVTVSGTDTAIADYYARTAGSFTAFGASCSGTTGLSKHTCSSAKGYPFAGDTVTATLSSARASTSAVFFIGGSNTTWGAFALPLNLGIVGINNCFLRVSTDLSVNTATNGAGTASVPIPVPNNAALIGKHVYSQFCYIDPGAPYTLPVPFSHGVDWLIGGDQ